MPRNAETFESRVLSYFKTAPLPEAKLVLGLCVTLVKERNGGLGPAAKPRKPKVDKPSPDTAAAAITRE